MTLPTIVGLNGVARSGKDTVAGMLHDLYGYESASFSDTLNKALIALNPWVSEAPGEPKGPYRYAEYEKALGYEKAKENPEVRRLLQAMGTEVGRDLLGENIWVEALFKNLPPGLVAIVNVRFPNEYAAVKERGGVVWRVMRPGFEPALGHISDTALDDHDFDDYILNDGSLNDLAHRVIAVLHKHEYAQNFSPANSAHNEGVRA